MSRIRRNHTRIQTGRLTPLFITGFSTITKWAGPSLNKTLQVVNSKALWLCQCTCGAIATVPQDKLRKTGDSLCRHKSLILRPKPSIKLITPTFEEVEREKEPCEGANTTSSLIHRIHIEQ